ncbi:MAG TPA: hypothetical protein PLL06_04505 [Acidobacteriota bacterium]|nr:hypothetical protein [Acidobacteriota bacterium]HNB71543.1 hypothetical protein [Acidobacteriota bacterium]
MMNKFIRILFFSVVWVVIGTGLGMAQEVPKAEVFAGYSFTRLNGTAPGEGVNANGASVSVAATVHKAVSLVADFGGYAGEGTTMYSYTFGPRFAYHSDAKITPFAHFLFGGAKLSNPGNSSGFAFIGGGGLDYKMTDRVSVRVIQGELFHTNLLDSRQSHLRLSTGIVFRFGKR